MKKHKPVQRFHEKQSVKNLVFGVSIALLLIYNVILTSFVFELQKANQSVNDSLAKQVFDLQIKDAGTPTRE